MTRYTRKRYLIKKEFQARLGLGYLLFGLGGGLFFLVLLAFLAPKSFIERFFNCELRLDQAPLLWLGEPGAGPWLIIVLTILLFVLATLLITHRIAGPLYRFERTLDNMLKGQLHNPIRLRNRDEGKELAEKINQFNAELGAKAKTLDGCTEAIAELLEQCRKKSQHLAAHQEEELNFLFWELTEKNKKIKTICESIANQEGGRR